MSNSSERLWAESEDYSTLLEIYISQQEALEADTKGDSRSYFEEYEKLYTLL